MPPDPTTGEWFAAGVAAALIAVVAGAHLVRVAAPRAHGTVWGRAAALLLGTLTAGTALTVVVLFAAGMRADQIDLAAGTGYPEGPLAGVLVTDDVTAADDVATYATALLLPIGAILGILAVAVASTPPRSGLRVAAGSACVMGVAVAAVFLAFDTGAAVAGVGVAALALFLAAGACLAVDALTAPRVFAPDPNTPL
jgi:hypothetical protein